ncbi:MAG: hypothetical protein IPG92_03840 [Flavobacteriales bacterium]|nr:hypothetical protein [Flavobacteriales bacterium]
MQRIAAWRIAALMAVLVIAHPSLPQQHAFQQVTSKDGLAQSQVRTIAQDGEGYLWFGTLGGASRFDGEYFSNLALQDGLPDAQVSAMLRAADGAFWMGAGNSLVRIIGRTLRTETLPAESKGARILGLARSGRTRIHRHGWRRALRARCRKAFTRWSATLPIRLRMFGPYCY